MADAFDKVGQDPQWVSDLRSVSPGKRALQSDLNSRIARKQLMTIMAALIAVFKLFLKLAIKLLEKHKRIWLLFQSDGLSSELHPFSWIVNQCLRNASSQALEILVHRLNVIRELFVCFPMGGWRRFSIDDWGFMTFRFAILFHMYRSN